MGFSFRETMKNALIQAIGKKPDFEIILAAGEWIKLGKMTESDLADIQAAIDAQYVIDETIVEEIPIIEETEV